MKTTAQKPMNFFPDACCFEIDVYHSLACYWVLGAGSSYVTASEADAPWLFPFLEKSAASRKITEYMQKLAGYTNGEVPLDVTSTALRVGGVEEVVNRTSDIVIGTIRGGWGGFLASVATIMEYYQQSHHTLSKGGRAVAGWPDPSKHVHPPSCGAFADDMDEEGRQLFFNFLCELFSSAHFPMLMRSHLRQLGFVMFASLVQYLQPFTAAYGEAHVVPATLFRVAQKFGYDKHTLYKWGILVAKDFALKNMANVDKRSDLGPLVVKLQQEIIELKEQNKDLLRRLAVQDNEQRQHHAVVLGRVDRLETSLLQSIQELGRACKRPAEAQLSPQPRRAPLPDSTLPAVPRLSTSSMLVSDVAPVASAAAGNSARPRSVLDLRQAAALYIFNCSDPILDIYKVWYGRRFTLEDKSWGCASKQDKQKLVNTMKHTESLMPDAVREALVAQPPDVTSTEYTAWRSAFDSACGALVRAVSNAMRAKDNKKVSGSVTVHVISRRLGSFQESRDAVDVVTTAGNGVRRIISAGRVGTEEM
jgi:transposase-like protein